MGKFEDAFKQVCELAEDFRGNENQYLSPSYQEAEVRRDYIDKFFEAIGWDIYHREQKNPYEQEVKVERGVSITAGKAQKRADYAFYISPEFRSPKFFVEAKKPSRNLKNPDDYFQTIRYGWNANTPVAVLTDFQEFHILDCRFKPDVEYVLLNQNHKSYGYSDYLDLEKFKEIYYLFSRDAVEGGSLQKYSDSLPKPKGKDAKRGLFKGISKPIDEDFLEYIDEVRTTLAKAFKRNDNALTSEQLTEVTQKTVDRLVFIRFLEDKLIEPDYYISELGKKSNPWKEFISICRKLDAKYNGIVFKETTIDKQNFHGPDEAEFLRICDAISHFNSPYDFHYIPIHILGSIYERFLGKIVTLKGRGVSVEEKPEVRKAGGVYYTPKYIVDYIVKNTVGKQIEGKTPEEITELRFADIACGSGSFLIGVYELLLEYHKAYYQSNPKKAEKSGCIDVNGVMVLSLKQKQEILLNNIYGVDIDPQAVEVTQLSLALKMLEDESTYTARQMQMEFQKKIIPEGLSKNIVCGNSLIGTDILSGNMFSSDEETKLNPMDFETVFPDIMRNGGFDAVVGNPPYTYIINANQQEYFKVSYKYQNYQKDLYLLFLERYGQLLRYNGLLGVIVSNTWLQSITYKDIRKYLVREFIWNKILHLPEKVFKAVVDTNVLIFQKNNNNSNSEIIVEEFRENKLKFMHSLKMADLPSNGDSINIVSNSSQQKLFKEIKLRSILLKDITSIYNGVKPFEKGKGKPPQTEKTMKEKPFVKEGYKPSEDWKPLLRGSLINRYSNLWNNNYWILYGEWLAAPRKPEIFLSEIKIMIRQTGDKIISTKINGYFLARDNLHIAILKNQDYDLNYILGILNSKLVDFYYSVLNPEKGEALAQVKKEHVENLPIKSINFQNPEEKHNHDRMVSLVEQMLEGKKQLHNAKTEKDKTYYERKCESLDKQIDEEVYKLYGLTEEEINIVESKN